MDSVSAKLNMMPATVTSSALALFWLPLPLVPAVMSSSIVTYTSVYSDSEPWRFQWVSNDELEAPEEVSQFPKQAPPSPNYVPGSEHPPSLDYVPGPKHPPSPDYVPSPEYPEYLKEDPREDPEEDPAKYPANKGDDDDYDYDEEEEEDEASNKDDEEEEHLAPSDSTTLPAIDHVPSAEDIKAFKTNESAPTPI
ncbi:hypothetical protein Tco_1009580 [Tanacetum coccineum]